jgi:hypothetical protein
MLKCAGFPYTFKGHPIYKNHRHSIIPLKYPHMISKPFKYGDIF